MHKTLFTKETTFCHIYPNIHEKHQYHVKQRSTMHMNKKKILIKCWRILRITKQFSMKNHIFQHVNRFCLSISVQCLFFSNLITIFGDIYFNYSMKLQSTWNTNGPFQFHRTAILNLKLNIINISFRLYVFGFWMCRWVRWRFTSVCSPYNAIQCLHHFIYS